MLSGDPKIHLCIAWSTKWVQSYPMTSQWGNFAHAMRHHLEHVPAGTFDYSINISLQHNYIFVETPKVCCSTIKLNLQRLETGLIDFSWPQEMDLHNRDFSPLHKPSQVLDFDFLLSKGSFYLFCFVRNPYTRLLSCYLDKIVGNSPPKIAILKILGKDPGDISAEISFQEFVGAVSSQSIQDMNPHWRPQFYQTFQDTLTYDFIGSYENFSSDFNTVINRISPEVIGPTGIETRHRTAADSKVSMYYSRAMVAQVNRIYEADFNYFGYDILTTL